MDLQMSLELPSTDLHIFLYGTLFECFFIKADMDAVREWVVSKGVLRSGDEAGYWTGRLFTEVFLLFVLQELLLQ